MRESATFVVMFDYNNLYDILLERERIYLRCINNIDIYFSTRYLFDTNEQKLEKEHKDITYNVHIQLYFSNNFFDHLISLIIS
jgi:hypothetical protein